MTHPLPLNPTKIKICGITREVDAHTAIAYGADALGFVFYPQSRRAVTPDCLTWMRQLPPFVSLVGLFVNPTTDWVNTVITQLPIDLLQFHGDESPEFCQQFNHRYLKAIPMQSLNQHTVEYYMNNHSQASGWLLDNYGKDSIGGSGTTFNWQDIPTTSCKPLIMAGGLNATNVAEVIRQYQPYGIDVSSGVESAPGIKSAKKMATLINAINEQSR